MKTTAILIVAAAAIAHAANSTIEVVRASHIKGKLDTVKRDFPTAPCPAYNNVVMSDDIGSAISGRYFVACDRALDGQDYQTVEENGSTANVPIIDCLSTCDVYALTSSDGCCGAIIDPDGVCQIVTGDCYGFTRAAGYNTFNYEGLSS